jgi:ABC-type Fe3+/spermidine/putrescine transport system ATPase subunit
LSVGATPSPAPAALELVDVRKTFDGVVAVDGVSLTVRAGEFVTLLGPSGCGKTTLLRIVAGLESTDSGDVRILGESVRGRPPYARDVGVVFQNYALFPHRTVFENIEFGLRYHGVAKPERARRVAEALELVHLTGVERRRPNQLSGGQQQRVALARSLVVRPKLLLLDEPLSNLDERLRERMRDEMKDIQREVGITFVYVTHDQYEALSLSDRLAVLRSGRIEQVGAPQEVYGRPRTDFVASFLGYANVLAADTLEAGCFRTSTGTEVRVRQALGVPKQVLLIVRGERVALVPAASEQPGLPATIERINFLGVYSRVELTLARGDHLVSIVPGSPDLTIGQRVIAQIREEDWTVLPKAAGAA